MPTATVTFNGRVTLPSNVRKELGLKTGDTVEFVETEKGRFSIKVCPEPKDVEMVIPRPDRALSLDQMENIFQ